MIAFFLFSFPIIVKVESGARVGVSIPDRQVKISECDSTKLIHVRQNGNSVVKVFRETTV